MRARILGLATITAVVAVSMLGLACGDDDDADTTAGGQTSDEATGAQNVAGAIVPDTFLTYDDQQFELKEILQANLFEESEFTEAGEASAIDVDGDPTVYRREGDGASVYTFFEASGSGEEAIPANWYRWEPTE